jgi:hypothetical protein
MFFYLEPHGISPRLDTNKELVPRRWSIGNLPISTMNKTLACGWGKLELLWSDGGSFVEGDEREQLWVWLTPLMPLPILKSSVLPIVWMGWSH